MVSTVLSLLEPLPPLAVLVVAVVLVSGETGVIIGLFFPVEITLLFVGFLSYLGDLPFTPVLLLMLAAALTGDALALRSGRRYGPRVRASRFGRWVGEQRWGRADQVLRRLGGRGAFVARWVPFVRTLLPRLAGSAGMPYRSFLPWNLAGVVTAVGSSVGLGYLAGASFAHAAEALGRATAAVVALIAVTVGIVVVGRWWGGRARMWHPATGTVFLFLLAVGLSWLVRLVVAYSGLPGVDAATARWIARHRTGALAAAADAVAGMRAGLLLVVALVVTAAVVTVVALLARHRHGAGAAGVAVPLLVLAPAAHLAGGYSAGSATTAALCTLAWLLAGPPARWLRAVAVWTGLVVAVGLLGAVPLYLDSATASGTVTVVLIGAIWPAAYLTAWTTRDRLAGRAAVPALTTGVPGR